ncbi:MAG TPA: bacteriohemerythrin [Desulfobacterales bacterium]|nr:bacteriohemerythrin [Desulfobacterales bacterium]
MPMIKWRDSYSVGVERFDQEHMLLVDLINEMFVIVRDKENISSLNDAISKLINYTKIHFGDEQKALEKINYPQLEEHKVIHQKLLQQVGEFQERIKEEGEVLRTDLYLFVRGWLVNHILTEDVKYSKYFEE